jgi:hypothetical protein
MVSGDQEQSGLIIDYCLGLCSPAERRKAEASIAHSDRTAAWHAQVQTALAFLSYLPTEPCPDDLAERTLERCRRLAASGASAEEVRSRVLSFHPRERFRYAAAITALAASIAVSVSVLISSLGSTSPYGAPPVPPEYFEMTSGNADLFDSNYVRLPVWDDSPIMEFMPRGPGPFPETSGSAGYDFPGQDPSVEFGPRLLPAASKRHVKPRSR